MDSTDHLLARAATRRAELKLTYAGALLPREAFELWKQAPGAVLIDVRTKAEWDYVGRVPDALEIEWNHYPSGRNAQFAATLQSAAPGKTAPLLFLCRSGVRSAAAADLATQLGYTGAINILQGFEGDVDASGHRNTVGGWRAAGLPWKQT